MDPLAQLADAGFDLAHDFDTAALAGEPGLEPLAAVAGERRGVLVGEQQNLAREKVLADIIRTQALAEADKVREGAKARAEATRLQGDAEAAAIEARGKALRDNPKLVELVQAERWNGVLPTTVLPNTAVPLLVNR